MADTLIGTSMCPPLLFTPTKLLGDSDAWHPHKSLTTKHNKHQAICRAAYEGLMELPVVFISGRDGTVSDCGGIPQIDG